MSWRPALVAIRARKPCVRLRLRLLGWNVLFMFASCRATEPDVYWSLKRRAILRKIKRLFNAARGNAVFRRI